MKHHRWAYPLLTSIILILLLLKIAWTLAAHSTATQVAASAGGSAITVPAGARVVFAVVRPVASKSAGAGDNVYLQTTFPVLVGDKLAIPAGTFVQGVLAEIPVRSKHQIELPMKSVVLIFGHGNVVPVSGAIRAIVDRDRDSSVLDVGAPGELALPELLVLAERLVAEALHHPRRLLAVHDLVAGSRPAQNPSGTCYTPEIAPKREEIDVGAFPTTGPNGEPTGFNWYENVVPGVRAKPGTPYPCP